MPIATSTPLNRGLAAVTAFAIGAALSLTGASAAFADDPPVGGTLTGHVFDSVSLAPIEGEHVYAIDFAHNVNLDATSGADGVLTFADVPFGTYHFMPTDSVAGYQAPFFIADVTVSADSPDGLFDVPMTPYATGTATLSGTITDAISGAPLDGIDVGLDGIGIAYRSSASTVDGAYSITGIPAGTFNFQIFAFGYVQDVETVTISDGQQAVKDAALFPQNSTIQGHVSDQDGNPVPFTSLQFSGGLANQSTNGITNDIGDYTDADLAPGTYTVTVGGRGTSWQTQVKTVTIGPDDPGTVDFVVTPRQSASISGQVATADGNPIPGMCEIALNQDTGEGIAGGGTDDQGQYTISDLDPGTYKVVVFDCAGIDRPLYATTYYGDVTTLAAASTLELQAQTDLFDISVHPALGGQISGHITVETSDGTVPPPAGRGLQITALQKVGSTWVPFIDYNPALGNDDISSYSILGLPAGTYKIKVSDPADDGARSYADRVSPPVKVRLGATVSGVDLVAQIPKPHMDPVAVPAAELSPAEEGRVGVAAQLRRGSVATISLGAQYAGEWVSVWSQPGDTEFGNWIQVASDGTIEAKVPGGAPLGSHKIVVQTANTTVIGWATATIQKK